MSEPIYTAKTWRDRNGVWRWQTYKNDIPVALPQTLSTIFRTAASRESALQQARCEMERDQTGGVEWTVLNQALPRESTMGRPVPGLYVVMSAPPSPDSQFVELEDQDGHGVGPVQSGAEWRQEGNYWTLGPFAPVEESK